MTEWILILVLQGGGFSVTFEDYQSCMAAANYYHGKSTRYNIMDSNCFPAKKGVQLESVEFPDEQPAKGVY